MIDHLADRGSGYPWRVSHILCPDFLYGISGRISENTYRSHRAPKPTVLRNGLRSRRVIGLYLVEYGMRGAPTQTRQSMGHELIRITAAITKREMGKMNARPNIYTKR